MGVTAPAPALPAPTLDKLAIPPVARRYARVRRRTKPSHETTVYRTLRTGVPRPPAARSPRLRYGRIDVYDGWPARTSLPFALS
ncbi:hypothetical protein EVAR_14086_1 [Eumeta japonica]|uniref:Uncharacterized protein n=1 Tax=Eumeta variegata TaxID=151549 RepID=A0A4C1UPB2_EUMVA|nr:hypothetical protein EVAR_14086_1 [Eumeta japonica]